MKNRYIMGTKQQRSALELSKDLERRLTLGILLTLKEDGAINEIEYRTALEKVLRTAIGGRA